MKIAKAYRATAAASLTTTLAVTPIYLEYERAVVPYKLRKVEEVKLRNIMIPAGQVKISRD